MRMLKHPERFFDYAQRYLLGYDIQDATLSGEFRMLRKLVSKANIVFEVGANIGNHIEFYFNTNKNVEVHAFEPSPGSFQLLESKFSHNHRVILNNLALSNKQGTLDFHIYWETGGGNSINYNSYQASIAKEVKVVKVEVNTLDNYIRTHLIQRIDFIKIDVEGHEYKVLQGLSESFALDKIAIIQFEYSSFTNEIGDSLTKICELLLLNRFRIYRITPWGKIRIVNFLRNENRAGNYLAIKK